jgi:hypothetical protein
VGYELPETFELSYEVFSELIGKGAATLEEVKELWQLIPADLQKETLRRFGVSSLDELSLSKAKKLLNRLREKKAEANSKKEEAA